MLLAKALSRGFRRPLIPTETPKPGCCPAGPARPTTSVVERPFLGARKSWTFLRNRPASSYQLVFALNSQAAARDAQCILVDKAPEKL